jgi:signal transduction histidine kinase
MSKGLVHDIKTPLSWLSGVNQILKNTPSESDIAFALDLTTQSQNRLNTTINDVSNFISNEHDEITTSNNLKELVNSSKNLLLLCIIVNNNISDSIFLRANKTKALHLFIHIFTLAYLSVENIRSIRDPVIHVNTNDQDDLLKITFQVDGDGLCESFKKNYDQRKTQRYLLCELIDQVTQDLNYSFIIKSFPGKHSIYSLSLDI